MGWRCDGGDEPVELGVVAGGAADVTVGANQRGGDAVLAEPGSDALGIVAGQGFELGLRESETRRTLDEEDMAVAETVVATAAVS